MMNCAPFRSTPIGGKPNPGDNYSAMESSRGPPLDVFGAMPSYASYLPSTFAQFDPFSNQANSETSIPKAFASLLENYQQLSFTEQLAKIGPVVEKLRDFTSGRDLDIGQPLEFLSLHCTGDKYRSKRWNETLLTNNVCETLLNFWPSFFEPSPSIFIQAAEILHSETKQNAVRILESNFQPLMTILWCATDTCETLCEQLLQRGYLINRLFRVFSEPELQPDQLTGRKERLLAVQAVLSIAHNCIRYFPLEAKRLIRNANGIKLCRKYLKNAGPYIEAITAIVMAYIVNDTEISQLRIHEDVLGLLLTSLERALQDPKRSFNGYSAEELMAALNAMAVNDVNSRQIGKLRGFDMYLKVLKSPEHEKELLAATKGFWQFTFISSNKDRLKKLHGLTHELRHLTKHTTKEICLASQGALLNLEESGEKPNAVITKQANINQSNNFNDKSKAVEVDEKEIFDDHKESWYEKLANRQSKERNAQLSIEDVTLPPITQHHPSTIHQGQSISDALRRKGPVMISYPWTHKNIVLDFNNALQAAGIQTWIDVQEMSGSTLDAMAQAIEASSAVIMCVSEAYKESLNCRQEASYAYKLNKIVIPVRTERYNADGWLGFILGNRLYFDIFTKDQISTTLPRILKELNRLELAVQQTTQITKTTEQITHIQFTHGNAIAKRSESANSSTNSSTIQPITSAKSWTKSQVANWLKGNDLGHLQRHLNRFDGSLLLELKLMRQDAPTVYYTNLETKLHINSLPDILLFTKCLMTLK